MVCGRSARRILRSWAGLYFVESKVWTWSRHKCWNPCNCLAAKELISTPASYKVNDSGTFQGSDVAQGEMSEEGRLLSDEPNVQRLPCLGGEPQVKDF